MRISKAVIAVSNDGRTNHYRTLSIACRQHQINNIADLIHIIEDEIEVDGFFFDWDLVPDPDGDELFW
jgi:hypothetical protein